MGLIRVHINGGYTAFREADVTMTKSKNKRGAPEKMLWPLVRESEAVPPLTDGQFMALETAGQFSLTSEARRALQNIAVGWTSHDRALHSPRPAEFRTRLRSMRASLERANAETDLLHTDAPVLDQHLYHWLVDKGLSRHE
jgi:hypothetical protein